MPVGEQALSDAVRVHIDRALNGMVATVGELGDELVNAPTGLPGGNTAYQIVAHCCGVLEFWGGRVLADREITRDRAAEFEASGEVGELLELIRAQRLAFEHDLQGFDGSADPPGPLRERDLDADELRTQAGVLLHVYEELAQHRGHLELTADVVRAGAAASQHPIRRAGEAGCTP